MEQKVIEQNLAEYLETLAKGMRTIATQLLDSINVVKEYHTETDVVEIKWQARHLEQHAEQLEFIAFKHRKKFE
jgi:hypothetical protein